MKSYFALILSSQLKHYSSCETLFTANSFAIYLSTKKARNENNQTKIHSTEFELNICILFKYLQICCASQEKKISHDESEQPQTLSLNEKTRCLVDV